MRTCLRFLGLLTVLLFPTQGSAATILWASTGGSNGGLIYKIDPNAQTWALVGDTGLSKVGGLAFDNFGTLYAADGGSAGPSSLYTINTSTAGATLKGAISGGGIDGVDAIRFNAAGTLYAAGWCAGCNSGRLLTLNAGSGAILTNIDLDGSGNDHLAGLAFDKTGQLYGSRGNASGRNDDVVKVNTTTGVETAVGSKTAVISDIWFAADNTLYGISTGGGVYTINATTGAKTLLFSTGISQLSGLAGQNVVPEPAVLGLLLAGLATWRTRARRRT